jgi:hypothetical protein
MDASNALLKTAIICPHDIYGQPTGTGNRSTYLVPEYLKVVMRERALFYLGEGGDLRAVSYIRDGFLRGRAFGRRCRVMWRLRFGRSQEKIKGFCRLVGF